MEKLLVVDDELHIRTTIEAVLRSDELQVLTAADAAEADRLMSEENPQIVLLDIRIGAASGLDLFSALRRRNPRVLVIFITGHGSAETAIETMKLGAFDYLLKPLDLDRLQESVEQARRTCRQMYAPASLGAPASDDVGSDRLIGSGPAMQSVCRMIGRVAPQEVNVLIVGESGSGKDLIARAIYQHSHRSQLPFLRLNCSAVSETLLESELFGHEKGAFAGAEHRRIGRLEQCHRGTLYLEDVADLPKGTQAKLLRLLQDGEFQRLGGVETLRVDVRILASSHRNLESMLTEGSFRQDLYYRLRDITIQVPALRERLEDIPELAHYLMFRFNQQLGTVAASISPEAIEKLQSHRWPGNIRELQGVLRDALVISTGASLLPEHFPLELRADGDDAMTAGSGAAAEAEDWPALGAFAEQVLGDGRGDGYRRIIQRFDRLVILHAMNLAGGLQSRAADLLGLSRPTLRLKLRGILSQQSSGHTETVAADENPAE
jgi:two-component system nitrogen regulation response regulator GlnG